MHDVKLITCSVMIKKKTYHEWNLAYLWMKSRLNRWLFQWNFSNLNCYIRNNRKWFRPIKFLHQRRRKKRI